MRACLLNEHCSHIGQLYMNVCVALETILDKHALWSEHEKIDLVIMHHLHLSEQLLCDLAYLVL